MTAGRALLKITVTTVRHTEVQSVRPQRRVLQRRRNGGIVQKGLLFHHGELVVSTDAQVGSAHAYNRVVGDVGELVDDQSSASHLLGPVVHRSRRPETFLVIVPVRRGKMSESATEYKRIIHDYIK